MSDNSSNNKRIAKNSLFMSIRMVIVLIITLYTTRATLAALGVVDYGVYNVVCGFVTMFSFLNTSLSNGIQRYFNFELGRNGVEGAKKVFNTSLAIQVALSLIIVLVVELIGVWYLRHKMVIPTERLLAAEYVFHFSVASMFFVILQAPYSASVIAHEKMGFYSLLSIIDVVLKLLIVLVLPFLKGDLLIIYGLLFAAISIVNFFLYLYYARRNFSEIRVTYSYDKEMAKSMLGFSGWNLFGTFSMMMREQGVNMVLNFFCGPIVNAARGVAAQVSGALESFAANLTIPVRPQVIQNYSVGNLSRSFNLTYTISKLSCFFLILVSVPIAFEIDTILSLWLGSEVPEHANTFVIIVLFTTFVNILMGTMAAMVHASGKIRNYQVVGSIVKILSLPVAFVLLYYNLPPESALISVFVFNLLGFWVGLYIIKGIMPFSIGEYNKKVILPILYVLFITLAFTLPICLSINDSWIRFVLLFACSGVSCTLGSYYIGLSKDERIMVDGILKNLLNKLR